MNQAEALAFVEREEQQAVTRLRRLVRQPSVAATGEGMAAAAALVAGLMDSAGLEVSTCAVAGAPPIVCGDLNMGARRTILFYNHYDVQPVDPLAEWEVPPFDLTLRDDRLYGRGVADNKGNLVARLEAVRAWRAAGGPPVNVKILCEGAEEIGSPGLPEFVHAERERLACDGVIWETGERDAAGRPQVFAGAKGILYIELRSTWAQQDLHSAAAALVESPVWHLVGALASLKDLTTEQVLVPGFYADVRPPSTAERILMERYDLPEQSLLHAYGIPHFVGGATGTALVERLQLAPTCNICGIWAGYTGQGMKTVLPRAATAKVDFRLVPDQRADDILAKVSRHIAATSRGRVEVVRLGAEEPAQAPVDHPLVRLVADTAAAVWGKEPVILPRMAGTGPMHPFLTALGVPVVNGAGCGYSGSRVHAPNEHILARDFLRTIQQTVRILGGFADQDLIPR